MFSFPMTLEIAVAVIAVCGLLSGLTYLALRRRDEILEEFLIPESTSAMEEQFLDRLGVVLDELPPPEPEAEETPAEEQAGEAWPDLPDWVNQQQMER